MEKAKDVPFYPHSASYAREHGELEAYRASYRENMDCRKALENAIHENYRDNCLNSGAILRQVRESFSDERIRHVLAVTVREKDWDGRIDSRNKAWAKTVPVTEDIDGFGSDRRCYYCIDQAHPGLVDLLVTAFRKEEALQKKQSILEKLQTPLPEKAASANKETTRER